MKRTDFVTVDIDDIYRYAKKNNISIIPKWTRLIDNKDVLIHEWLEDYFKNIDDYDIYIYDNFYSWYTYVPETEKFPIQLVQDRIEAFNKVYDWKYRKIYEAMKLKYEPLENYRRNETVKETYTPNLTTEDTKIASFSDILESSNNRNETASSSATIGANNSETTATYGNETNTNKVSPYDSENSYNKEISERSKNNDTTQVNNSERTDSGNTQNNITETLNNEHTISDNTKNTNVQSGNSVNARENLTFGNIGVTTSQKMLEEEFNVANRSFLHNYFMDMIKEVFVDFDW